VTKKKAGEGDYMGPIVLFEKREQSIIHSDAGKPLIREDVVGFYRKGELSLSQAAVLLNLSEMDAAKFLKHHGV
jgi:predicted HTH domain antitoxin